MLDQNAYDDLFNKYLWLEMIKKITPVLNLTFIKLL